MEGKTSHVHLVNNGPGGRPTQQDVAFPIVSVGIHDDALHRSGSVVAYLARSLPAVIPGNNYAAPIGVEENLGAIKPHPAAGVERPLDPIPVELARLQARHEEVPIIVGTVGRGIERDHARGVDIIFPVKEQQLHS